MGRVYVIRHGKAHKDSPTGRDEDRALKDRGRRQAQWLAETLAAGEAPPSVVLSSGLVRAVETARPIAAACGVGLEEEPLLEGGPAGPVVALIESRFEETFAVVGHNPQLSDVVEELCGRDVSLRTGEGAVIDLGAGEAELVEFVRLEE